MVMIAIHFYYEEVEKWIFKPINEILGNTREYLECVLVAIESCSVYLARMYNALGTFLDS